MDEQKKKEFENLIKQDVLFIRNFPEDERRDILIIFISAISVNSSEYFSDAAGCLEMAKGLVTNEVTQHSKRVISFV